MSIKEWWQALLKKGFKFSWSGCWPGEKDLPDKNCWPKTPTDESIRNEILDKLKRRQK